MERIIQCALNRSLNNTDYRKLQTLPRVVTSHGKFLLFLYGEGKMNQDEWDDLRDELAEAADGSNVSLTTCDSTATMGMGFVMLCNLQGLSH